MADEQAPPISFLDPDVLALAIPFAIILDILGYLGLFFTLGIGGIIAGLILGIPLTLWMASKDMNWEMARHRVGSLKKGKNLGAEQAARVKKVALKRVTGRSVKRYLLGSFLVFLPYWTWAVFQLVQTGSSALPDDAALPEKEEETAPEEEEQTTQEKEGVKSVNTGGVNEQLDEAA
ncbi:MAG: hypothetical protein Q8P70_00260 [bacterium]|nr:hypothetical protein [bacterium]